MKPRRRVRRKAHGRLVAQGVERQPPAFLDHLEERKHEIARDPEDFPRTMLGKGVDQSVTQAGHSDLRGGLSLDRRSATGKAGPGVFPSAQTVALAQDKEEIIRLDLFRPDQ